MKLLLSCLLLGLATATANVESVSSNVEILKRDPQGGSFPGLSSGGKGGLRIQANPVRREELKPLLRPNAKRVRLYYGPYNIYGQKEPHSTTPMPMKMDPNSVQLNRALTGFCTNCTVLYGKADTFYESGARAGFSEGIYVHHIVVVDLTKRSMPFYLCKGQGDFLGSFPAAGFIVAGNDEAANYFTTPDGKFDSGYYIGQREMFAMQAEIINYKPTNQSVYITAEFEYLPGKISGFGDSTVSLLSVTGCKFPDYHPPPGEQMYNTTIANVPIPMDGQIINAKGHLHDGGVSIVLELNGKPICDSKAIYGGDSGQGLAPSGKPFETIRQMTQCTTPVNVKKGDVVGLKTYYDTKLHPLRPAADGHSGDMDEMGVFFINFSANPQKKAVAFTDVETITEDGIRVILKQVDDVSSRIFI